MTENSGALGISLFAAPRPNSAPARESRGARRSSRRRRPRRAAAARPRRSGRAAALRDAQRQSFWADEAYTAALVRESLPELLRTSRRPSRRRRSTTCSPGRGRSSSDGRGRVALALGGRRHRDRPGRVRRCARVRLATGRPDHRRVRRGEPVARLVLTGGARVRPGDAARRHVGLLLRPCGRRRAWPAVLWLAVISMLALLTHYYALLLFFVEVAILLIARPSAPSARALGCRHPSCHPARPAAARARPAPVAAHRPIETLPFRPSPAGDPASSHSARPGSKIDHVWTASAIALLLLAAGIWLIRAACRGAGMALALAAGSLALAFAAKVPRRRLQYYRPLVWAWMPAAIAAAACSPRPPRACRRRGRRRRLRRPARLHDRHRGQAVPAPRGLARRDRGDRAADSQRAILCGLVARRRGSSTTGRRSAAGGRHARERAGRDRVRRSRPRRSTRMDARGAAARRRLRVRRRSRCPGAAPVPDQISPVRGGYAGTKRRPSCGRPSPGTARASNA